MFQSLRTICHYTHIHASFMFNARQFNGTKFIFSRENNKEARKFGNCIVNMVRLPLDKVSQVVEAKKHTQFQEYIDSGTTRANKHVWQMSGDARHMAQQWVSHLIVSLCACLNIHNMDNIRISKYRVKCIAHTWDVWRCMPMSLQTEHSIGKQVSK